MKMRATVNCSFAVDNSLAIGNYFVAADDNLTIENCPSFEDDILAINGVFFLMKMGATENCYLAADNSLAIKNMIV